MRQSVLKTGNLNLFIQDDNFDSHLIRYHGVILSSSQSRIAKSRIQLLLFRHRLDLSITWTCNLDSFKLRQIFRVKGVYPCDTFRIVHNA